MDRTERFQMIDQLLANQKSVTKQQFLDYLEVSLATFKRDIEYMRDRLGAPIIWRRDINAYVYEQKGVEQSFQMPGLWFNTAELHALLTMDALLENLQQGLLTQHIKPLQARIRALFDKGQYDANEVGKRIRVLTVAAKIYKSEYFQLISQALLGRFRLLISYYNRAKDETSERIISPQRLIFYRDNWYLDAWCHQRKALRSFSVDVIQEVEVLTEQAKDIDDEFLNQQLSSGYGIFSGKPTAQAKIKFSKHRARWVSREQWHPEQRSEYDKEGNYFLTVPYSQPTELIMDVLRHGSEAEVLEPKVLRLMIAAEVKKMQDTYKD